MSRAIRRSLASTVSASLVIICTGCFAHTYSAKVFHTYVPKQGPDENFRIVKQLLEQQKTETRPLPAHLVRMFERAIADARAACANDNEVRHLLAQYEQIKAARRGVPVPVDAWPKEFVGPLGIEYVLIPPGEVMMGSDMDIADERPIHAVRIERPFYMGKYEVTQAQWRAVMENNSSRFSGDARPVERVTWNDCQLFCSRLSARIGIAVRLPSEAEWEYACRAGSVGRYCYGNSVAQLGQYAWHGFFFLRHGTRPVGQKHPNALGLYDMHGNVGEWCQDVWHGDYSGAPSDGSAWMIGGDQSRRVQRGGAFLPNWYNCRSAYRGGETPGFRYDYGGFRLASGT